MILDSNIIIYASAPDYTELLLYLKENESDLRVSAVSKLEVLGYQKLQADEKEFLENFFITIPILSISESVIERAIFLKQQRKMSIGDSIIAATGLLNNLPIFTDNEDDFKDIENFKVITLKEIVNK